MKFYGTGILKNFCIDDRQAEMTLGAKNCQPEKKQKTKNKNQPFKYLPLVTITFTLWNVYSTDHAEINNLRVPCYFTWFSQVETMSIRNKTFLFKLIKLVTVDNVQWR